MKDKILKLRDEGKTYTEIKKILGCSKGTISYHCGEGQKEKSKKRLRNFRKLNSLTKKIENFKSRGLYNKSRDFQRNREKGIYIKGREFNFTQEDVLSYLTANSICYLTGEKIDLTEPSTYSLDHIHPVSKGGDNSLSNLGLTLKTVNKSKNDLTVTEFINLCKTVLEYNGHIVKIVDE
jgi:CRISPR/Cas system Type II protein with McrA/HNH and RuvC-like nuclease domain